MIKKITILKNNPKYSFSNLHYKNCHGKHTKNNIALPLAIRIVRIVTDNKTFDFKNLKVIY